MQLRKIEDQPMNLDRYLWQALFGGFVVAIWLLWEWLAR